MRLLKEAIFITMIITIMTGCSTSSNLVSLDTRDGIKQKILIETPSEKKIKGTILLFIGGSGKVDLSSNGLGKMNNNFLARTRSYWHNAGYQTVIVDVPSDKTDMYYGHRNSQEHVQDIEKIIDYLGKSNPVWLNGTSRGSESVAYIATQLTNKVDGIILTSSMTQDNEKGSNIFDFQLEKINIPVFIASHKKDGCSVTPPSDLNILESKLQNAKPLVKKLYDGGSSKSKNPCQAKTYHGFLGIEKNVLHDMIEFVNMN